MKLSEGLTDQEKAFMSSLMDELNKKDYIDWNKSTDSIYIANDQLEMFKRDYREKIPVEFIDVFSRCVHPQTWEKLSELVDDGECWNFWPDTTTKITIPDGVKYIPEATFCGCNILTSIVIPDSVEYIGAAAFEGAALKTINIPAAVRGMGTECFLGCPDLMSVVFAKNAYLDIINERTFAECINLKSVVFPERLVYIYTRAFYDCASLTAIQLPDYLRYLGEGAFESCTSLTTVQIPDGVVTVIDPGAFEDCPRLVMKVSNEEDARKVWHGGCRNVILRGKPYQLNESLETQPHRSKADTVTDFIEDLYDLRKSSIATDGEYGLGNLVFKEMRSLGYLDNLRKLKNEIVDKELSLESLYK